jgi:LacI family transcriptional regulator
LTTIKQTPARRQHARITISDVARLAGVSPMTVSRVVNGEVNVRERTRDAVNLAIRELGYFPNKAARSLASANPVRIGLLYTNPSSAYLSAMLLGVLEQARQSDTQVVVVECDIGSDAIDAIQKLMKDGVDGVLLAPPLSDSTSALKLLRQYATPAVTIGTQRIEENIPSVSIDDHRAAYAMTQHIIALGHRRIGFIIGSPEQLASELRLAGFRAAMHDAGLEVADEWIVQGQFSYRSGLDAAEQLLALDPLPTAIFASNDDMAAATVATAHRHRINVPGDLTVCGFDDTLLATTIWPEITTICQPIADMSHAAIELLDKSIRCKRSGTSNESEHLTLDFQLIRRQSDGPPPHSGRQATAN